MKETAGTLRLLYLTTHSVPFLFSPSAQVRSGDFLEKVSDVPLDLFGFFDTDGDGQVTMGELEAALLKIHALTQRSKGEDVDAFYDAAAEAAEAMAELDVNHDGTLSLSELINLINGHVLAAIVALMGAQGRPLSLTLSRGPLPRGSIMAARPSARRPAEAALAFARSGAMVYKRGGIVKSWKQRWLKLAPPTERLPSGALAGGTEMAAKVLAREREREREKERERERAGENQREEGPCASRAEEECFFSCVCSSRARFAHTRLFSSFSFPSPFSQFEEKNLSYFEDLSGGCRPTSIKGSFMAKTVSVGCNPHLYGVLAGSTGMRGSALVMEESEEEASGGVHDFAGEGGAAVAMFSSGGEGGGREASLRRDEAGAGGGADALSSPKKQKPGWLGSRSVDKISREFAASHSLNADNVFCFCVEDATPPNRLYYFVASNVRDGRKWVEALQYVVKESIQADKESLQGSLRGSGSSSALVFPAGSRTGSSRSSLVC